VIHVEAFSSINCLVAVDPEGLDTFIPAPPRRVKSYAVVYVGDPSGS
jgi:hypothetical protein